MLSGTYIKESDNFSSLEDMFNKTAENKKIKNLDKNLKYLDDNDITLIDYFSDNYPKPLRNLNYAPAVLFVAGSYVEKELSISIVGTRYPSGYGQRTVKYLIPYLTKAGFSIVSGMAKGIDAITHKETLNIDGYTIAVLGSGIDVIYPKENKELYYNIKHKGCIISEFPLGTQPLRQNFPRRNRLIAALSKGTIVVEADIKSGSLITARLAEEFSKPVFAVPGEIFSKRSKGTNKLISEGAIALCDIDIVMSYFYLELKKELNNYKDTKQFTPNNEEQLLLDVMEAEMSLDELILKTNMDISKLNDILFDLEIKGLIRRTPSDCYEKL